MSAAALIRESLGRVRRGSRQPSVDVVVAQFARLVGGLEDFPPRRRDDALRRWTRALRWGHASLIRSRDAIGYAEVAATVEGVLSGCLEVARGN